MNRSSVSRAAAVTVIALLCIAPAAHGALISSSTDETVIGITLSLGPGSVTLPIAGNMTGTAFGEAAAGTTPATAILTELTRSAGPGAILTAGPPAVGGSVGFAVVTNTHSNLVGSATATTAATIRGVPTGPGGGVINMVTVVGSTPTSATASGVAFAAANASVHDPFALSPLPNSMSGTLTIDLDSDLSNLLELGASAAPGGSAMSSVELDATSDIPGLASLFDLDLTDEADGSGVDISFSSTLISDPLTESDFTALGGGAYELNPADDTFTVPFTIPAGVLNDDPTLGPVGFELDTTLTGESIASAPEPSGLALLATGLGAMAVGVRRRQGPGRPG